MFNAKYKFHIGAVPPNSISNIKRYSRSQIEKVWSHKFIIVEANGYEMAIEKAYQECKKTYPLSKGYTHHFADWIC